MGIQVGKEVEDYWRDLVGGWLKNFTGLGSRDGNAIGDGNYDSEVVQKEESVAVRPFTTNSRVAWVL